MNCLYYFKKIRETSQGNNLGLNGGCETHWAAECISSHRRLYAMNDASFRSLISIYCRGVSVFQLLSDVKLYYLRLHFNRSYYQKHIDLPEISSLISQKYSNICFCTCSIFQLNKT